MQQKSQTILYNWQAMQQVFPYLSLNTLLQTSTVSKQWQYNLKQWLKKAYLTQNYQNIDQNVFQAVKSVYNRRIYLQDQFGNKKIRVRVPGVPNHIQMGNQVTKLQMLDGSIYLIQNTALANLDKKCWQNPNIVKKLQGIYKSVFSVSNYVYICSQTSVKRYTASSENILNDQQIFYFQNIQKIVVSSCAVMVITKNDKNVHEFHYAVHKDDKFTKVQLGFQVQVSEKCIILDEPKHALLVSVEGNVYELDLKEETKISEFKLLKNKKIAKIDYGYKHYFAYEKKQEPISKWSHEQVAQWAESNGFSEFSNILRSEKTTGEKLLSITKNYMQDVLGMLNTATQQKFKLCIQEANNEQDQFRNYQVYCWGRNDKGQLAMPASGNINSLTKVKLAPNQSIVGCVGEYTLIKNTQTQEISVNRLDSNGKLKWEVITNEKLWSFSGNKGSLLTCESASKEKVPQALSSEPVHTKKQKLRTAKNIIDQIQWDSNLDMKKFDVGYSTRHEGNLQCSFEEFLKSDIKEYSVLYFKQNGKLVWDKKTRLDIL